MQLLRLSSQENSVCFYICAVCTFLLVQLSPEIKKVQLLLDNIVNSLADITYWRPVQSFEELLLYSRCFSCQQMGKKRAVLPRKVPFVHALVGDYPGSVDQTSSGDGPSCFE